MRGKVLKGTLDSLDKITKSAVEHIAQDNCLAIIALSQCSYRMQMELLKQYTQEWHVIQPKMFVMPPPQERVISKEEMRMKFIDIDDELRFIMIGGDFFRKGGAEVINVLSKLHTKYKFSLTVISSLTFGDYVTHSTKQDQARYEVILRGCDWITWHRWLPNNEVLQACIRSHVGLLPTYADTYGYSVLEMQAAGCPVVTTDIRALPEMNNDSCGWVLHLPQDEYGEALYGNEEQLTTLKKTLNNELERVLGSILCKKQQIPAKGEYALNKILKEHDPNDYGRALFDIYSSSLR
jgi:glycosyltransferase involved in cell wall biosynthesis